VCELYETVKCNSKNIKTELQKLLEPNYRKELLEQYDVLESKLGGIGASEKTAQLIVWNNI
jgi:lipid-A-disaccharide synthase